MKSRRSLLATAIPLLVGGCISDPPATEQSPITTTPAQHSASPTNTPETQTPSPDQTQTSTPECTRGYTLSVSPFAPTEQLVTGFRPAQQRLVDRIITEDGVVLQTYGQRPVRTEQYTRSDDTYYRIDYEQTSTEEVQAERADISWEKGQQAPDDATVVNYTELPEIDQHALEYLIHGPVYSREGLPTQGMTRTDSPAPYPQGTTDSVLVGAGTMWIEWNSRVYKVTIASADKTITRRTFNYSATRVANSQDKFRSYAAEQYLKELEGLGEEARSVLEAAIEAGRDGRYEECNEPSPGYKKLKERLKTLSELPDPQDNHWYISYEGERYLLESSGWVV